MTELTFCHGRSHPDRTDDDIRKTTHIDINPDANPDIVEDMLDFNFQKTFPENSINKMRFVGCPIFLFHKEKFIPWLSKLVINGEIIVYGNYSDRLDYRIPDMGLNLEKQMTLIEFFQNVLILFRNSGYFFDMSFVKGKKSDKFIYKLLYRKK